MLKNFTPHAIHFPNEKIIKSSGCARCALTDRTEYIDGIHILTREFGDVSGLPEPDGETIYIVSSIIRNALPERMDLASPYNIVREDNKVVLVKSLIRS